jgi:hypothetical protein
VRCGVPVLLAQPPTPTAQFAPMYGGAPVYAPPMNSPTPQPIPRRAARQRRVAELGAEFVGLAPATTGRRVLSYSIDAVAVALIAGIVWVTTASVVYGAVVALELVVGLTAWQATKGLTLGNLLLGIRTTRDDRPYTPGIGRGFARSGVTAAGFLVAAVGGWVVAASSAWDSSGKNRGWQDRLAGTLTIAVPASTTKAAQAVATPVPGFAPQETAAVGYQAPRVSSTRMLVAEPQGEGQREQAAAPSEAPTQSPMPNAAAVPAVVPVQTPPEASRPPVPSVPLAPQPVAPAAVAPTPAVPTPVPPLVTSVPMTAQPPVPTTAHPPVPAVQAAAAPAAPAAPAPPAPSRVGALLFLFDTGQRETVASPGTGYLGRNPSATGPEDQLISVQDPDRSVSKVHLYFEARGAQLWITDRGSTNGTDIIDDEGRVVALPAGERAEVPAGSRVRLGDRTFAVSVVPPG